jgi:hypothetical protein
MVKDGHEGGTAMIELLDPTREIGAGRMVYAPRPDSLKGKKVGLIENTKYNSDRVLEMIGKILVDEYGVAETKLYHKRYSSVPAHEEIIRDVRATCDFMIAGVGDCGSCSSGSVLDGILLEKEKIPSASIITHVFINTGRAMAKQWSVPDYKFLVMQHPIANISEDELLAKARAIVPEIVELLLAAPDVKAAA